MKRRKRILLLMTFIVISIGIKICAQGVTVTGKVMDEEGLEVIAKTS